MASNEDHKVASKVVVAMLVVAPLVVVQMLAEEERPQEKRRSPGRTSRFFLTRGYLSHREKKEPKPVVPRVVLVIIPSMGILALPMDANLTVTLALEDLRMKPKKEVVAKPTGASKEMTSLPLRKI